MEIMNQLGKRILFFDGGMGSLLQEKGLKPGELPETWNVLHPEIVTAIHREYLEAGCNIITVNTFGANRFKYNEESQFHLEQIVAAAVKNGKEAVKQAEKITGKKGYVALDMGPTGKLLKPLGDLDFEDAVSVYSEIVKIGAREGADCIIIETMSDGYEMKAAVLAAKENSHLPVFATVTFDEKGKLLTGGDVLSTVALLEGLGVDALGINCGLGPVQMKPIVEKLLAEASIPVIVNPNAGLPRSENGKTVYDIDPGQFAQTVKEIVEMGAWIVGGCCGTTPEHMRKTVELCKEISPVPIQKKEKTVVTSWSHGVEIGKDPVIIGERINPTGKSRLKQALKDYDLDYLLQEGVAQQENRAHILDVNVGLPGINEPEMMEEVVKELQSVLDLPLQIDTSDPEAMERAMRVYNGKPMVNSVNGKEESMNAVFPLVKKYGGVVVALALDEKGIPDTAQGRLEIADKIYKKALEYGIEKKNIVVDALCLTISSDSQGAVTTLETVKQLTERNWRTVLGVSNISFGLPQREIINGAFYTMALQNGLSAAIINPNSQVMMKAFDSYRALAAFDSQCADYIGMYAGTGETVSRQTAQGGQKSLSLGESIEKGLKDQAGQKVAELLETREALEIIQEEMVPALDRVGQKFEKGIMFLPQLLMSAEAAKAAFEIIKIRLAEGGEKQEKKGKIILATVKGDIHDIGKNIVKVLLENYSYEIIDLGKDVPPETVVETAVEKQVRLVGLSALMTTTVPSMEETIKLLRKQAPKVKVMVGGAVLTEEYAKTIDADQYCKDAMASVKYAESIFGKKE
ncbi:MAG: homocysteine S-methyltransferase family protein [Lachnoclostridium edouardi]|uniref:homocysteine S-methyltransferase family protein n=1 Tax=Lachnoclostridium edouardi TaxID=1926283 RepID=UPI0026DAA691|nr:homocysteine S-methyltransferase family protein [Lachnoclostridium edouardi]MDO4279599.1 homocysteine S-methyltransferase family protein [Lachnoclostridium edouardi]